MYLPINPKNMSLYSDAGPTLNGRREDLAYHLNDRILSANRDADVQNGQTNAKKQTEIFQFGMFQTET